MSSDKRGEVMMQKSQSQNRLFFNVITASILKTRLEKYTLERKRGYLDIYTRMRVLCH